MFSSKNFVFVTFTLLLSFSISTYAEELKKLKPSPSIIKKDASKNDTNPHKVLEKSTSKTTARPLPIELIQEFTRTFDKIRKDYVEEVEDKTILTNAIKGMLSSLDPHSNYLDIDSFKEIKEGTTGEFSGLGMEVGMEEKLIKVISPIDGSPAKAAGIKAGDYILKISGKSTRGMSLEKSVKLMRGKVGTSITITILHEGEKTPKDVTIKREVIKVSSIRTELLKPNFAFARISSFQLRSANDLRKKITQLVKDNKKPLKGLILDLRNNPGGILAGAVDVSDLFLNKGLVVYTQGRNKSSRKNYSVNAGDILKSAPIIVLVNKGSASASEIVAGALQDHKRAIIMGQKTFGKGSVQTILPMSKTTAIKLTTARYYTPSGRSIQATGIVPDILIENWRLDKSKKSSHSRVGEADLAGHLIDTTKKSTSDKGSKSGSKKVKKISISEELETDYLLNEALNLLMGLSILSKE